ncbi:hypothetical protein D3C84_947490 [compost metagenome]
MQSIRQIRLQHRCSAGGGHAIEEDLAEFRTEVFAAVMVAQFKQLLSPLFGGKRSSFQYRHGADNPGGQLSAISNSLDRVHHHPRGESILKPGDT